MSGGDQQSVRATPRPPKAAASDGILTADGFCRALRPLGNMIEAAERLPAGLLPSCSPRVIGRPNWSTSTQGADGTSRYSTVLQ
jgi:hypothetical protein